MDLTLHLHLYLPNNSGDDDPHQQMADLFNDVAHSLTTDPPPSRFSTRPPEPATLNDRVERFRARLEETDSFDYLATVCGTRRTLPTTILAVGAISTLPMHYPLARMHNTIALCLPDGNDIRYVCLPVEAAKQLVNRLGEAIAIADAPTTQQDAPG